MKKDTPDWVEQAANLPIAFAQVREDALQDLWVVENLNENARVVMIASGGCTVAALACSARVSLLHAVDPNPAQLALTKLKINLVKDCATLEERLDLLGHSSLPTEERATRLNAKLQELELHQDVLGPRDFVARVGPDHAGRYEVVFAKLREALRDWSEEIKGLLSLSDTKEQAQSIATDTALGRALDKVFDETMALPNLIELFGAAATQNRVEDFSKHFARRMRHVLAALPASSNPYLWQVLLGEYPPSHFAPWLTSVPQKGLPEIVLTNAFMCDALKEARSEYDFVHLSNILDWLTPEEATQTLEIAWRALRPNGFVLIRQLNSTLDIRSLGQQFQWHRGTAAKLHAQDRSYFYRNLHLGQKK